MLTFFYVEKNYYDNGKTIHFFMDIFCLADRVQRSLVILFSILVSSS